VIGTGYSKDGELKKKKKSIIGGRNVKLMIMAINTVIKVYYGYNGSTFAPLSQRWTTRWSSGKKLSPTAYFSGYLWWDCFQRHNKKRRLEKEVEPGDLSRKVDSTYRWS
jgi:hypothetical protein